MLYSGSQRTAVLAKLTLAQADRRVSLPRSLIETLFPFVYFFFFPSLYHSLPLLFSQVFNLTFVREMTLVAFLICDGALDSVLRKHPHAYTFQCSLECK